MKYKMWQTIACLTTTFCSFNAYQAVVTSPIVDLVGAPLASSEFTSIPLCGGQKEPFVACKRGHQLLFNEVVDIVDQTTDHVCVAVPNIFYIAQGKEKKYNRYWAEKKHFVPLTDLADCTKIPKPLSPNSIPEIKKCAVLMTPHHDPALNTTFSTGTRFVRSCPNKKEKKISAWILDKHRDAHKTIHIPATKCYLPTADTHDARIADFVHLVRHWAHLKKGYIPYVWGGSSCSQLAYSPLITEKHINKENKIASFYCIDKYNAYPMSGFDCSSLISRAAQICNIPYYFKNTTTLARFLTELDKDTLVENGDLIWIPWHVMIVSDVKKNLLVEARSYSHGYGKVHELPLHKVFKNIQTYDDLAQRLFAKKPLERINKSGKIMDTFWTFKILKMNSVFTHQSNTL